MKRWWKMGQTVLQKSTRHVSDKFELLPPDLRMEIMEFFIRSRLLFNRAMFKTKIKEE